MNTHNTSNYINSLLVAILFFGLSITTSNAQFDQFTEADNFVNQGDYQSALSELNNYIELQPADEEAYVKRAMVHQMLGHPVDRDQDLALARHLNPYANLYISMEARFRYTEKKDYGYEFNDDQTNFLKSPIKPEYYQKLIVH